jgi:threonine dehydrogenase-like Zn-dependent dehydrogenase
VSVGGCPRCGFHYATHRVPLDEAQRAYELFQKKEDNAFKILLQP